MLWAGKLPATFALSSPWTHSRWVCGHRQEQGETYPTSSTTLTVVFKADSTGRRNTLIMEVLRDGDEVLVCEDERGS